MSVDQQIDHAVIRRHGIALLSLGASGAVCCALVLSECVGAPSKRALPLSEYTPRDIGGFATLWHPDCKAASAACRDAEDAAAHDLAVLERRVPCAALRVLQTVRVVFSLGGLPEVGTTWEDGPRYYHRDARWLALKGIGADRLGAVEIADSASYTQRRQQKPAVLLHELAHAYLERSGAKESVRPVFEQAKASGRYESVWKRDWSLEKGTAAGYAITSVDEYFAELSEAYFWVNDWYPFRRFNLTEFDPAGADVVRHVWAPDGDESPCAQEQE